MQEKAPLWRRILRAVLMALLTLVLLAAFYLAVIMGNPAAQEETAVTVRQDQPLLSAMPAPLLITQQEQLSALQETFPAPMMTVQHTSAMHFVRGLCEDVPFEKGLARRITLTYQTAEGKQISVVSLYPARALSLISKADYTFTSTPVNVASLRFVRMENADTIRLHAQGTEALYVITLPKQLSNSLSSFTSALQMHQGE